MQSEDDFELSELSSSNDRNVNSKNTKRDRRKTKLDGYRLRNVLKPGRTTHYTAKALYDQIIAGDIELDPEYQRGVVWSDIKQVGLIDSIFRNFYVPPIIFSVTTEDDGTEKRVCIDGKQRLTSIQNFMGGLIPHRDPYTNEKLWFCKSSTGQERKLLPPQYRTLFQNKQLVCVEYNELPPQLEREVFQRVQMGMALTQAEKLQVITGPWPDLVREIIQEYYFGKNGINANMDLDQTRAREFQNISHTLFCIDQLPAQVQGTAMQVEKWLAGSDGPSTATRAQIHETFKLFKDLSSDENLHAPFKNPSRVAPVEFIMTGVLIRMLKDTHSLQQLSRAIGNLRAGTRAEYDDVRTNSKVLKTMFDIISEMVKTPVMQDIVTLSPSASKPVFSQSSNRKRRWGERGIEGRSNDDDDDDDYKTDIKPRSNKMRVSGHATRSNTSSATHDLSATSPAKIEEIQPSISHTGSTHSMNRVAPTGMSRLEQIRTAQLQMANLLDETRRVNSPALSPSAVPTYATTLPDEHFPPAGLDVHALDTRIMSSAFQHSYPPSSTRPNHAEASYHPDYPDFPYNERTSGPTSSRNPSRSEIPQHSTPDAAESGYTIHGISKRQDSSQSPRNYRGNFRGHNAYRNEGGHHERESRSTSSYPQRSFARHSEFEKNSPDVGEQRNREQETVEHFKSDSGWPRKQYQGTSEHFRRGPGYEDL